MKLRAINQQSQPVKKTYSRLSFDEVRKAINAIDDEKSLDEYGAELKKKHTNRTTNQAKAISEMFNKRREELKDYKAAEPLIKDEKIRKAVRAWAEVNSIKEAMYAERSDRNLCLLTDMGEDDYNIDFVGWIPTLKDGKSYTIAELCGEEEE